MDTYKYRLVSFLAKFRLAVCTGYFLSFLISKKSKKRKDKCINILYLPKLGFNQDIESIFKEDDNYCLYQLKRKLLKTVFYQFLPKTVDDNNYIGNNQYIQPKKDLRAFWVKALRVILKKYSIDIVLTGNFSYASEQEFAGACEQLGIKFVALHKECLKTPGLTPFYTDVYRTKKNKFQGSLSLVYNEIEKEIQRKSNVVSPEDIIVTGMARMDRLHKLRPKRTVPARPQILFFSFNPKAGLPIIGRKIPERFEKLSAELDGLHLQKLSRKCHHLMLDIAKNNPDITVIIKTKGDGQSLITLNDMFGEKPDFPSNLEIMAGGDLIDILNTSCVATGFNSTALLEAIALGVAVVVPYFDEAVEEKIQPYIVDMGKAVTKCTTIEDYKKHLIISARNLVNRNTSRELGLEQKQLLDHWLGNPDGCAGQRILSALEKLLDKGSRPL